MGHGSGPAVRAVAAITPVLLAGLVGACGDDSAEERNDRGAGMGALGGSAETETLARTRIERRPSSEVAWVAYKIRFAPGQSVEHHHELAFAYVRRGALSTGGASLGQGEAAVLPQDVPHRHEGGDHGAVLWEIRLARPGASAPPGTPGVRPVFESAPLEGVPAPAEVSLIEVTVPPRGGRTTVHTHPGPEFVYQLSGRIDYQNEIVGIKRLGPGGAEGIPPGTAVQKRNPYADPATFLSLFLVDPDRPFAPKASF
jgi:quercetin dioxygenase-like cupin family protein